MTSTRATKKQAEAIKLRMRQIRTELPYEVDTAREQVKQLSDWRFYVRRHPLPFMSAAAVAAYLLVPKKSAPPKVVVERQTAGVSEPAKKGLVGGVLAAVGTLAMKQGASFAAHQLSNLLLTKHKKSADSVRQESSNA